MNLNNKHERKNFFGTESQNLKWKKRKTAPLRFFAFMCSDQMWRRKDRHSTLFQHHRRIRSSSSRDHQLEFKVTNCIEKKSGLPVDVVAADARKRSSRNTFATNEKPALLFVCLFVFVFFLVFLSSASLFLLFLPWSQIAESLFSSRRAVGDVKEQIVSLVSRVQAALKQLRPKLGTIQSRFVRALASTHFERQHSNLTAQSRTRWNLIHLFLFSFLTSSAASLSCRD